MNEGNVPTLKHTDIIAPQPSKPGGLYYSFHAVLDFAEGRRKGVDGDGKEVRELNVTNSTSGGKRKMEQSKP